MKRALSAVFLSGCAVLTAEAPPAREDWARLPARTCDWPWIGLVLDAGAAAWLTAEATEPGWFQGVVATYAALYWGSVLYGVFAGARCSVYGGFVAEHAPPACADDLECTNGRVCRLGVCSTPGCQSDADCKVGRICLGGACEFPEK